MEKLLMRPAEAAELLAVSRSKLYQLIAAGKVPSVRVGKSLRLPTEALRRWVEDSVNPEFGRRQIGSRT
jgi:excisionase family DNA binding protein